MASEYESLDAAKLDEARADLNAELIVARRIGATGALATVFTLEALGALLNELADIAWTAPGGHGFQVDEARRWVEAINGER